MQANRRGRGRRRRGTRVAQGHNGNPVMGKNTTGDKTQTGSTCIKFSTFHHSNHRVLPRGPPRIFEFHREVAIYNGNELYRDPSTSTRSMLVENLKPDIARISKLKLSERRKVINRYLGADLYDGWVDYEPMSRELLDTAVPCLEFLRNTEQNEHSTTATPFTIVTARHHLVNIAMSLFADKSVGKFSIICTLIGDVLMFSEDISDPKTLKEGLYTDNEQLFRICYSGIALEALLTKSESTISRKEGPSFSIVQGILPKSNINIILRCEMDSYNPTLETYTEIKCFSKVKISNPVHRRKLLKTWLQTSLIPSTDIIIGTRDPYTGTLENIEQFTREKLLERFNNRNIPPLDSYYNFNAQLAVEWLQFCVKSICTLVSKNRDNANHPGTQSFRITIDKNHNIHINVLDSTPQNVVMPV